MATRVVREHRDEVRRQFRILVAVNIATAIAIAGCVYAFDSVVH